MRPKFRRMPNTLVYQKKQTPDNWARNRSKRNSKYRRTKAKLFKNYPKIIIWREKISQNVGATHASIKQAAYGFDPEAYHWTSRVPACFEEHAQAVMSAIFVCLQRSKLSNRAREQGEARQKAVERA